MHNTVIIDSIDRNWILGDKTFEYTFRFSNDYNESLGVLNKKFKNVSSFYIEYLIVPNIFIDIDNVHCIKKLGLIPESNEEIVPNNIIFSRISDLKYIVVNVDEIEHNVNGTNNVINKSTCIFLYDNVIPRSTLSNRESNSYLDNSNIKMFTNSNLLDHGEGIFLDNKHEFILFKNISENKIQINNNLHINNIQISLHNPNGEKLKLMNDSLTIKNIGSIRFSQSVNINNSTITSNDNRITTGLYIDNDDTILNNNNTFIYRKTNNIYTLNKTTKGIGANKTIIFESRKIFIECNEFFSSEEYKLGDTIILKNINKENIDNNLSSFLERNKGHIIVSMRKTNVNSTLYNIIEILPDITIDLDTGNENIEFYNLNNGNDITITGNLINKDNQHLISIDIETE